MMCYIIVMKTTELYSPAELFQMKKRRKRWRALLIFLATLMLGICVFLCLRVTTRNAAVMEKIVILVSILSGWLLITLRYEMLVLSKREAEHATHMLTGPHEKITGMLSLTEDVFRIPGSIRVRRLTLETDNEVKRLSVSVQKLRMLGDLPRTVTVTTVHDFIVAAEDPPC